MSAETANQALKGMTFLELDSLQSDPGLQSSLEDRLTKSLTSWALFGAANHKGGDYGRALDLTLAEVEAHPGTVTELTVIVPPPAHKEIAEALRLRGSRS